MTIIRVSAGIMEGETGVEIDEEILASFADEEPASNVEEAESYDIVEPKQVASYDTTLHEQLPDAVEDMTYGRRLARKLSKHAWYNPHVADSRQSVSAEGNGEVEVLDVIPPSLDSAWAYFEHYTLPRHLLPKSKSTVEATDSNKKRWSGVVKRTKKRDVLLRAKYGERDEPTRLYNFVTTPESEFSDFGIGMATYFWTVRVLAIILLLAGFINVPTMIFFSSTDYSELGQSSVSSFGVVGSAICTDQVWKACPTCSRSDWSDFPTEYERFASTGSLNFILRNECRYRLSEGIVALVSLLFMCISIYVMGYVSKRREVKYDESQQTTSDYSLEVENPPLDAKNPNEWRDFFSQFGNDQVTFCTIALDNEDLVRALVQRRNLVNQIEYLIRPGIRFDKDNLNAMVKHCYPAPLWKKLFLFASDAPTLLRKVREKEEAIKKLAAQEQNVSNVFVTFQTEQAQRLALENLSVRRLDVWTNATSRIPESLLFRGKHVLSVREPPEPSSVRWEDLADANTKKVAQILTSTFVSLAAVAAGAVFIALARRRSAVASAIIISILNQVTPRVCRFINNRFESHSSDGSRQASLYIKMTFFRWVNTVVRISKCMILQRSLPFSRRCHLFRLSPRSFCHSLLH